MLKHIYLMLLLVFGTGGSFAQSSDASLGEIRELIEERRFEKAMELSTPLADLGDNEARFLTARALLMCECKTADNRKAVHFLAPAAEEGHKDAQFHLGSAALYGNGGVVNDPVLGLAWLIVAGLEDDGFLISNTKAWMNVEDISRAERLAEHLSAKVQDRRLEAARDMSASVQFPILLDLARSGKVEAQYELAELYYSGQINDHVLGNVHPKNLGDVISGLMDVKYDYGSAFTWYEAAAEQGFALAQKRLGDMYKHGQHVDADPQQATKWYELAILQDEPLSAYALAEIYMKASQEPNSTIFDLLRLAATSPNHVEWRTSSVRSSALYTLSELYWEGIHVEANNTKSYALLVLAELEEEGLLAYFFPESEELEKKLEMFLTTQQLDNAKLLANKCRLDGILGCEILQQD